MLFEAKKVQAGLALALACWLPWHAQAEEEGAPKKEGDAPVTATPGANAPQGERKDGMPPGGGPDMARAFRGRGNGGFGGGNNPTSWIDRQIDFMVGRSSPVEVESLDFGAQKRFVVNTPVGGVDNLDAFRDGLKAEEIFTLTEEQTASLDGLRKEYAEELKKLQAELDAANKAFALKVVALREQYEGKANEQLGDKKAEKEQLDALAKAYHEERAKANEPFNEDLAKLKEEATAKGAEARENRDWRALAGVYQKGQEVMGKLREAIEKVTQDTHAKMLAALTGDAKTKLETQFKELEDRRQQMRDGGRGRGGPNGGDRGGRGNEPQGAPEKPAAPPGENF